MIVDTIVLARGGSKGIPRKNIIDFCGKPLLAWTIEQCIASKFVLDVWVSSDSYEILEVAESYNAKTLLRPDDISNDYSTSEAAWLHAVDHIEKNNRSIDLVLAPQAYPPDGWATDSQTT
jgi:CMP-N,N'-diacetyllegionaminic acid synthase